MPLSRKNRSSLYFTELEAREVPAVTLAQLPDQVLSSNASLYLPVTVTNAPSAAVTTTVTSSNPNAEATVVSGGQSIRFTVSGTDSNNQAFTGTLTLRLFERDAPQATTLLKQLVTDGFYEGKLFHRVIPNFVIQGGSPNGDGIGGSTRPDVPDEFSTRFTFASNGLLAMANAGDDNNNSQFFITDLNLPLSDRPQNLNFNHTITGLLTSGFETYNNIRNTPVTNTRPNNNVTITRAEIIDDTANAVIRVTPNASFSGTTTLSILSSDGTPQTGTDTVVLTREDNSGVNSRPFLNAVPDFVSAAGAPVSFTLTSTDIDSDSVNYQILDGSFNAAPANVTISVNAATGVTTLTPAAGFFGTIQLRAGVRDNTDRSGSGNIDASTNYDTEAFTLTVSPGVTLTLSATTVDTGADVELTATTSGPTNLAGRIEFRDDTSILSSVPTTDGTATFTTNFNTAGERKITATFLPTDTTIPNGTSEAQVLTVNDSNPNVPPVVPPVTPPVVPPVTPPVTPPTVPPVIPPVSTNFTATGSQAGSAPLVTVFNANGSQRSQFSAFEDSFLGGVQVFVADVTGDGVADIVAVPGGGGGSVIKVFDADGKSLLAVEVFEPTFRGGLNLAVGDLAGLGYAQIIVGAGFGGGPRVLVYDAKNQTTQQNYFAFDSSERNGVTVAVTDLKPGSVPQILAGTTAGIDRVSIFNGRNGDNLTTFQADPNEVASVAPITTVPPASLRDFLASSEEATTSLVSTPPDEQTQVVIVPGGANQLNDLRNITISTNNGDRVVDLSQYLDVDTLG